MMSLATLLLASGVALRVERPADGAILHTRLPILEVCLEGADSAVRSTFEATLDGESIAGEFSWSGDCATWHPEEGWTGFDKQHAWSDPPYEMEGWTAEMRDGAHDLETQVTTPSGETVTAKSRFRIETTQDAASLGLGFQKPSLQGFDGSFARTNLLEARFGSQRVSTLAKGPGVVDYRDRFASLGGASTSLGVSADPGETETRLWRGMAGERDGYGYRTGDASVVIPYHGTSVLLAHFDPEDGTFDPAAGPLLERYEGSVEVGTAFEGGVAFVVNRSVTLDLGYEQTAVYPHYLFWKAAGSGIVHGLALGIADGISRQVARKSPRAAPIVAFLLSNGISYVIHHQRRSEVNWPFGGDPGLVYDGLKVSATFTF